MKFYDRLLFSCLLLGKQSRLTLAFLLRIGICAKFRICSFTVLYSFAHGAQVDHQADGELLKGGEVGDVLEERAMRQEEREIGKRPSLFDEAQALGLQRLPCVALAPLGLYAGASLTDRLLTVRFLSDDNLICQRVMRDVWQFLRPHLTGKSPVLPRIWLT